MESPSNTPNARPSVPWPVMEGSLWFHFGLIGAGLFAWGVAAVVTDEVSLLATVAALVTGVAIAVLSLRRAWRLLYRDVEPEGASTPPVARSERPVAPSGARGRDGGNGVQNARTLLQA